GPMSNINANGEQCRAIRKDGTHCHARATASGLCFAHDPSAAENRRKGGHNRSNAARMLKLLPSRLRPVADVLQDAIEAVRDERMKPQQLQAMAAGAGALVKVIQVGELEERVRQLEGLARAG